MWGCCYCRYPARCGLAFWYFNYFTLILSFCKMLISWVFLTWTCIFPFFFLHLGNSPLLCFHKSEIYNNTNQHFNIITNQQINIFNISTNQNYTYTAVCLIQLSRLISYELWNGCTKYLHNSVRPINRYALSTSVDVNNQSNYQEDLIKEKN